jgi:DNA replication protein DnaC
MMNASGARENACTRGVVYTLVDFTLTTNLPFSKWTELFENTTMVAALIDRLTFRSHVLDMNGDSYRLKATMEGKG